jgi:hypothetical protein
MGTIFKAGTATIAPDYHCSAFGTPIWSGKHSNQFTDAIEQDLREFIKREASRNGHNDRALKRVGANQYFFDEFFLGGWPHKLWLEFYEEDVSAS